jgi:hypothetical protein
VQLRRHKPPVSLEEQDILGPKVWVEVSWTGMCLRVMASVTASYGVRGTWWGGHQAWISVRRQAIQKYVVLFYQLHEMAVVLAARRLRQLTLGRPKWVIRDPMSQHFNKFMRLNADNSLLFRVFLNP